MAYLVTLNLKCQWYNGGWYNGGCDKTAIVSLRDWHNESRGKFCKRHGEKALSERSKFEQAHQGGHL